MDFFGLKREERINKSGIRQIFTPHMPVLNIELFLGRQKEVQSLIEQLNTPGQHALLFGDRGVGKSSLANIASDLVLKSVAGGTLIKKRCDSLDTFVSIVAEPLREAGIDVDIASQTKEKRNSGKAGLKIPVVEAGVSTETSNSTVNTGYNSKARSPSWVAGKIKDIDGLFLIDEVDAISDSADKKKLAELIKQLSDEASSLKILLVGIADTADELTAGHPSVSRCLKETKLNRMTDQELSQVIIKGQEKAGLTFSTTAIDKIVAVCSGYPHFTHLLALKAAEDAIAEKRDQINSPHVLKATSRAVGDAEGTLKRAYDDAIRSAASDEYRKILVAACQISDEGFSAKQLRDAYKLAWGPRISQGMLNNHFKRLVSDDHSKILQRLAKGVYRFVDPRMRSFIQIANLADTEGTGRNKF